MTRLSTLAIGLLLTLASTAAAQTPLKTMLDALDLPSVTTDYVTDCGTPFYRVVLTYEGVSTRLLVYESAVGKERCTDENFKLIGLMTPVLPVPEGFRHPPAMLRRIAELNADLKVGRLGMLEGSIYYSSAFFSRGADENALLVELYLAHGQRLALNTELAPYLDE